MTAPETIPLAELPRYIDLPRLREPLHAGALHGRVIAVTGATGGLGTALSKALAEHGAAVVLLGRSMRKLEALYDVVDDIGEQTPAIAELDLAKHDTEDARAVAEMLFAEFGRLDGLVHAAVDTGASAPQDGIASDEFERVFRVNVAAPRALTLACLPLLARSANASIVWPMDHRHGAYVGAYGLSKSAARAFVHALAEETEHRMDGSGAPLIAVNGYFPGPMRTPLRRRLFAGEHATESPEATDRLAPLLHLLARTDRSLSGAFIAWPDHQDTR